MFPNRRKSARSAETTTRSSVLLTLTALLTTSVAACGGMQSLDHGEFRKGEVAFHVPPAPSSWRQIRVSAADVAYRADAVEASILVNGRCGKRDGDTPLRPLTEHLILGTTERDVKKEETISLDGREALHSVMQAKLDGVPMAYDIYVLKKDGCVYDFVYVAPPTRFADGAAEFEAFVQGFHTLGAGAL